MSATPTTEVSTILVDGSIYKFPSTPKRAALKSVCPSTVPAKTNPPRFGSISIPTISYSHNRSASAGKALDHSRNLSLSLLRVTRFNKSSSDEIELGENFMGLYGQVKANDLGETETWSNKAATLSPIDRIADNTTPQRVQQPQKISPVTSLPTFNIIPPTPEPDQPDNVAEAQGQPRAHSNKLSISSSRATTRSGHYSHHTSKGTNRSEYVRSQGMVYPYGTPTLARPAQYSSSERSGTSMAPSSRIHEWFDRRFGLGYREDDNKFKLAEGCRITTNRGSSNHHSHRGSVSSVETGEMADFSCGLPGLKRLVTWVCDLFS